MSGVQPTIFLVDDDPSVLKAVSRVLRVAGFQVAAFGSAQEFLDGYAPQTHGCLLLDIGMPGLNGLELQRALRERGSDVPIVFLTGRGDIPTSVRAMKQGAMNFLTKPADDEDLIKAVQDAIDNDRNRWQARSKLAEIHRKLATLTPREREVLTQVISGKLNKQTAADLGIVEKTIKVHRAHIMEKMQVTSLAELVRQADLARGAAVQGASASQY